MMIPASPSLRHSPKQARGQRRVEHILRSAEELFAEVGFESATTNGIAARAGISIGSLYQFFAHKEAILLAIAERYLDQTRSSMAVALADSSGQRLESLLLGLLDTLIKLQERRPYFLQCLSGSHPSPVLKTAVARLNEAVAAQVAELLERGTTETDPKLLSLRARICVETMGALLPLAVWTRGRERAATNREITAVLLRYIEPTLKLKGTL